MPIYHKLGEIPQKRHTVFQSAKGAHYYEQLFGTEGFHGMSSLLYHVHRPTQVKEILKSYFELPSSKLKLPGLLLVYQDLNPKVRNFFLIDTVGGKTNIKEIVAEL